MNIFSEGCVGIDILTGKVFGEICGSGAFTLLVFYLEIGLWVDVAVVLRILKIVGCDDGVDFGCRKVEDGVEEFWFWTYNVADGGLRCW